MGVKMSKNVDLLPLSFFTISNLLAFFAYLHNFEDQKISAIMITTYKKWLGKKMVVASLLSGPCKMAKKIRTHQNYFPKVKLFSQLGMCNLDLGQYKSSWELSGIFMKAMLYL